MPATSPTLADAVHFEAQLAAEMDNPDPEPSAGADSERASQEQRADREPQLKYDNLEGDVSNTILKQEKCSCLKASEKILALGTHQGVIHILDYSGNEVKRLQSSNSAIIDISIDKSEEYLASCSQDGAVVIYNLYTDKSTKYEFKRPARAVCLDPRYAQRKTREFATANASGCLTYRSMGWFGRTDSKIHQGEGSIHSIVWGGSALVWANDIGVRVYDTNCHSHVYSLDRPKHGAHADRLSCCLLLINERDLYIGWPDCVAVALLMDAPGASGTISKRVELLAQFSTSYMVTGVAPYGEDLAVLTYLAQQVEECSTPTAAAAAATAEAAAAAGADDSSEQQQEATAAEASTINEGPAAGAEQHTPSPAEPSPPAPAPSSSETQPAAQRQQQEDQDGPPIPQMLPLPRHKRTGSYAAQHTAAQKRLQQVRSRQARPAPAPLKPELKVVSLLNQEKACDVIHVEGYEQLQPAAYSLVASLPEGAQAGHQVWSSQQELLYYVVSPQDIVVGKPRGAEDRIRWKLEHRQFAQAVEIAAAERQQLPGVYEQVVQQYLEHLFSKGEYEHAARLAPRLLETNAQLWERWVHKFGEHRQLPLLVPLLPLASPQLQPYLYDMALTALVHSPAHHALLLQLLQEWPAQLYSQQAIISEISGRVARSGDSAPQELMLALAQLHQQQGRADKALGILLQLQAAHVFDFIQSHGLLHSLASNNRAQLLLGVDEARALQLLVAHYDMVPPHCVVPGLQEAIQEKNEEGNEVEAERWRRCLHDYLHALFLADPTASADYHQLQVQLYAEYSPSCLMPLLTSSQFYALEAAYDVCAQRGMVPEMVYILSRMGSCQQALQLIIERQADIPAAIQFVQGQADDELWGYLIDWALAAPHTTAALLDNIGGHINPLKVIERIPLGMQVPKLRDRLRAMLADFRTQTSLREGCAAILHSDCLHLMQRLQREVRRACPLVYVQRAGGRPGTAQWLRWQRGVAGPAAAQDVPQQALQGCGGAEVAGSRQGGSAAASQQLPRMAVEAASSSSSSSRPGHRRSGSASSGPLQNISAALSTLSSQQVAAASSSAGGGAAGGAVQGGSAAAAGVAGSVSPVKPVKMWVGYAPGAGAASLVLGTSGGRPARGPQSRHSRGGGENGARPLASLLDVGV